MNIQVSRGKKNPNVRYNRSLGVKVEYNMAFRYSGTSLTGSEGVFLENGLKKVEGIGWERLRITLKARQEFKFNVGILEPVSF